jgi:hypothetical protein
MSESGPVEVKTSFTRPNTVNTLGIGQIASRLYLTRRFIIMAILMTIKSLAIKSVMLSIATSLHLYMGNFRLPALVLWRRLLITLRLIILVLLMLL